VRFGRQEGRDDGVSGEASGEVSRQVTPPRIHTDRDTNPPRRHEVTKGNNKQTASSPPVQVKTLEGNLNAGGKRFAVVVSRFNEFITERLFRSAFDGLLRCGAKRRDIAVVRVPGAFEIPSAARTLATTKKYDAIICLGCLIRGDTAHYDVIVNEVTRGIGQSAQETGVPHAFGVLTCENLEQAIDRAGLKMGNKGFEAALAAVEMANLTKTVVGRSSSAAGEGTSKTKTKPTQLGPSSKPKPKR
jgi:6,7-dimethyl-8-ribityllumazine synthase